MKPFIYCYANALFLSIQGSTIAVAASDQWARVFGILLGWGGAIFMLTLGRRREERWLAANKETRP